MLSIYFKYSIYLRYIYRFHSDISGNILPMFHVPIYHLIIVISHFVTFAAIIDANYQAIVISEANYANNPSRMLNAWNQNHLMQWAMYLQWVNSNRASRQNLPLHVELEMLGWLRPPQLTATIGRCGSNARVISHALPSTAILE